MGSKPQTDILITELNDEHLRSAAMLLCGYLWPTAPPVNAQEISEENLRRLLRWPGAQFFVASISSELVGFISLNWGFSTSKGLPILRVQDVFTHPDHRRSGVAKGLIMHAERLARESGANRLQLETGTSNQVAQALYRSMGFERMPDKEILMYFLK